MAKIDQLKIKILSLNKNFRISIILIIGFIIRIISLIILSHNEFPDSTTYINAGKQLFENGIIQADNVMPLYPIITYLLHFTILIKVFDIIISTLTIYMIYLLCMEMLKNEVAAIISAVFFAVYPLLIFMSISVLTETTYIFLILLGFYLFYKNKIILGSMVFVASILERPTLDLLAPIIVIVFSHFVHKLQIKKIIFNFSAYLIIYIIIMSPWWVHNHIKYDSFVRLNLGDGIVWYSGNNPLNKSGGGVAGSENGSDMDLSKFAGIKNSVEKNNAMKEEAFIYIKNNPIKFAKLMVIKFFRFWRPVPYAPELTKPLYIILSFLSYTPILILAIVSLIKNTRNYFNQIIPILIFILYLTGVHMLTISSIRYRLPVDSFLIIFASFQIANIINQKKTNCVE